MRESTVYFEEMLIWLFSLIAKKQLYLYPDGLSLQGKFMQDKISSTSVVQKNLIDTRKKTEALCQALAIEDYVIQAMPDVSPAKWHLAHTTWFFETFLLGPYLKNYRDFHPNFNFLFNSYYESLGSFYPRDKRGLLSRPTVEEIYNYRHYVDENLLQLIENANDQLLQKLMFTLMLGINHEQQHQELLLMDVKYNFAKNPLQPVYAEKNIQNSSSFYNKAQWLEFPAGLYNIGYNGEAFAYDNEMPFHPTYLANFKMANRLITNQDYIEFIEAGGYKKAQYWLSDGWHQVKEHHWEAPLYWTQQDNSWWVMTLHGMQQLHLQEPVCHVSYYEASAYAKWAQARLPTEAEWEIAAAHYAIGGNFLESGNFHPIAPDENNPTQFYGDVWEWTQSPYMAYPGYQPFAGNFSEYNGKFACNQMVLRGGCALTPQNHLRLTYRNFYYPHQRWPFTGFRLAK